jgi:hypothetical protein
MRPTTILAYVKTWLKRINNCSCELRCYDEFFTVFLRYNLNTITYKNQRGELWDSFRYELDWMNRINKNMETLVYDLNYGILTALGATRYSQIVTIQPYWEKVHLLKGPHHNTVWVKGVENFHNNPRCFFALQDGSTYQPSHVKDNILYLRYTGHEKEESQGKATSSDEQTGAYSMDGLRR